VFPGGARLRPELTLAVAAACGDPLPPLSDAAAAAIELIHCASLVHDDLPCFDNAATRRGRPAIHVEYGEALAVLAGDALIVLAFQSLATAGVVAPERLGRVIEAVARGVSCPHGIIAGQGWESEPRVPAIAYRRAKTAALFVAAASAGATAAGRDPSPWFAFAERIGEAYQVADDIQDVVGDAQRMGKPIGRDAHLGRPNAVHDLGVQGSSQLLAQLLNKALAEMPPCAQPERLRAWVINVAERLIPARRHGRDVMDACGDAEEAPSTGIAARVS
jgi:geranylgeranyl diphosphate synthase type II